MVARANQYARDHGKSQFVIYQGAWNVMLRDFERDILPMARYEGMALAPWNVLAGGKLRTDAEEERRRQTGEKGRTLSSSEWERNENEVKMSRALEKVAKEVGTEHITAGKRFMNYLICHPLRHIWFSCSGLYSSEGTLCLPYHWWTQS